MAVSIVPPSGYAVGYGLRNVVFGGEIAFFNRGRNLFADGVLDGVAWGKVFRCLIYGLRNAAFFFKSVGNCRVGDFFGRAADGVGNFGFGIIDGIINLVAADKVIMAVADAFACVCGFVYGWLYGTPLSRAVSMPMLMRLLVKV